VKRKLNVFSASQIKQFDRCGAFWAFNRVLGLPDVQTDKARRGVEIHREMELYALLGQWPESKAARKLAALYVCPPPGVAEVEVPVRFQLPGGTEWVGYIDAVAEEVYDPTASGCTYGPLSGDAGAAVVLIDWKTTSDFKYALSPAELAADTAANIYAYEAFAGGAGTVVLRWVYVKANGDGKPRIVETVVDRAANAAIMDELAVLGWFLQQLYDMGIDPHLMTKEPDNCFKYGAMCPYREQCNPPAGQANDYTADDFAKEPSVTNDEFMTRIAPALPKRPAPPLPVKASLQKALDDGAKTPVSPDGVLDRVLTKLADTPRPDSDTKALLEAAVAPDKAGWLDMAPTVEAGFINAPEGATVPLAATPEEAAAHQGRDKPAEPVDELETLDKQSLFVLAVKEGCFLPTDKVKLREQGLRRAIREARTKRAVLGDVPPTAPVPHPVERQPLTEAERVDVETAVNAIYDAMNAVGSTDPALDDQAPEASPRAEPGVLAAVHETAQGLAKVGIIDEATMAEFDKDCGVATKDEETEALWAVRYPGYGCLDPQKEIVGLLHRIASALEKLAETK